MNAVLIYDDFDCALKAKAMLERAAWRANEATNWRVMPWRVDLLGFWTVANAVAAKAANAHLIVLGLRHPQLFPAGLVDWLERWATQRQVQDAALAVFDGGNGDSLSETAAPELAHFADRHGLSFIFGEVGPTQEEPEMLPRGRREREEFARPALPVMMAGPVQDCHEHEKEP